MVLSRDTDKVAVLMRAFSRLDIDVVVCSDPSSAIALMDRKKFEAVVIDFGVPGSDSLLHDICRQQTNVMVAAILNPQTTAREAFALGARFSLPGIHDAIDVQGQIAWVDKNGRAGIRFLHVPSHLHGQLKQWLFPTLPDSKIVR